MLSYLSFLALGKRSGKLFFTPDEKKEWNENLNGGVGKWFTITNVVGSLTSLSTAYLFFIGSSKLFGWFAFFCAITIWLSGYITNYVTKKILVQEHIQKLFSGKDQVLGVISTLFWRENDGTAILTSKIVRWLSLLNIAAVIWLEFSLFSDIASLVFDVPILFNKVVIIFVTSFFIIYFTTRFGLRGFVFADAFQSPVIMLSAITLVIGSVILLHLSPTKIDLIAISNPILSTPQCLLFVAHVLFLNSFIGLVTEGHWLRVWIFEERETILQPKAQLSTAIIWGILIVTGLFTAELTGRTGENAIINLITKLFNLSPVLPVFFWLGATAALFSTADAQIYSFLLVFKFNTQTGKLTNSSIKKYFPLSSALAASFAFAIVYYFVRKMNIPFEKIIFIIMPMSLNLLPAFVRQMHNYKQRPILLIASIILYSVASYLGFTQPEFELQWTLTAALMPIICSIIALKK
jgi:hypothetical protein